MAEGLVKNLDGVNDGILERDGNTHVDAAAEVNGSFDRNHFLARIKSRHSDFRGPGIPIIFAKSNWV